MEEKRTRKTTQRKTQQKKAVRTKGQKTRKSKEIVDVQKTSVEKAEEMKIEKMEDKGRGDVTVHEKDETTRVEFQSFQPAPVSEVTRAKYSAGMPLLPQEDLGDLPLSYGEDRLVLIPRDPEWVFVEWEISAQTYKNALEKVPHGRPVLRLFVDSGIGPAHFRDHDVSLEGGRYYARTPSDNVTIIAELGIKGEGEAYVTMLRSLPAKVPAAKVRVGEPKFMTLPLDIRLPSLKIRGKVSGERVVSIEGKVLTEEEYKGLFGVSEPASLQKH